MKEEKTLLLIESIPGFDMRLKLQGDPVRLTELLCGAMTVDPVFRAVVEAAVEFLPEFQACVNPQITKDFKGNVHQ